MTAPHYLHLSRLAPASAPVSGTPQRLLLGLVFSVVTVLTMLGLSSGASAQVVDAKSSDFALSANGSGKFRMQCGVSHADTVDPIVFPGSTTKSHMHTFFGNTGINAHTTANSLRTTGSSTCEGVALNRSAYWVPTLYNSKDEPLSPAQTHIYYSSGRVDAGTVKLFPKGLRIVAGSAKATSPQPTSVVSWFCTADARDTSRIVDTAKAQIPVCQPGQFLQGRVTFPQCWDGRRLDSPDHNSHMAYASGGKCPATHPRPLPEISQNFLWRVTDSTRGWRLSSDPYGGGVSLHADWFDGWDRDTAQAFVTHCINGRRNCRNGALGNGKALVHPALNYNGANEREAGAPNQKVAGSDPTALPLGYVQFFKQPNGDVKVLGSAVDLNSLKNPVINVRNGPGPAGLLVNKPTNTSQHTNVATTFPGYGRNKGFEYIIPAAQAHGTLCVYVSNIKLPGYYAPGSAQSKLAGPVWKRFGCETFPPPTPTGNHSWVGDHFDDGALRTKGWARPIGTSGRAQVTIRVNGVVRATVTANGYFWNPDHYSYGWDVTIRGLANGNHTVCPTVKDPVFNTTTQLECKTVRVEPEP